MRATLWCRPLDRLRSGLLPAVAMLLAGARRRMGTICAGCAGCGARHARRQRKSGQARQRKGRQAR